MTEQSIRQRDCQLQQGFVFCTNQNLCIELLLHRIFELRLLPGRFFHLDFLTKDIGQHRMYAVRTRVLGVIRVSPRGGFFCLLFWCRDAMIFSSGL